MLKGCNQGAKMKPKHFCWSFIYLKMAFRTCNSPILELLCQTQLAWTSFWEGSSVLIEINGSYSMTCVYKLYGNDKINDKHKSLTTSSLYSFTTI